MPRYIDADAFIVESIKNKRFVIHSEDFKNDSIIVETVYGDLLEAINNMPTVDAVEVIRCRDCLNCGMKASIKYDGYRDDVRLCMLHGIPVLPNDYCSGGVKMDAEVSDDA